MTLMRHLHPAPRRPIPSPTVRARDVLYLNLRAEGVEASEATRRAFAEFPTDTARHHPSTPTHLWES